MGLKIHLEVYNTEYEKQLITEEDLPSFFSSGFHK